MRPAAAKISSIGHKTAEVGVRRDLPQTPIASRSELITQYFPKRGQYNMDGLEISTCFPFGFFRRGEKVANRAEVIVYPSIREVSFYFHLLPFLPGQLEGMRLGQGESLYSIRWYQEGESARIVDWKASAKTGELMALEYAREEESKFCLILDPLIHLSPRSKKTQRKQTLTFYNLLHFREAKL